MLKGISGGIFMDSGASAASSRAATPANTEADNQSKLKTLLGILRRFIGVTDIATVRFSLPSQLIEPIPNLEYWHYLDRPETFANIGDPDDELGRCLSVLRFWFTKDLKFVKGKPCKPYNSALGEVFRAYWDVEDGIPHVLEPADHLRGDERKAVRVSFLTEQTSHHPPVSAFYIDCKEKGISARGFDQISAKFTGTSIKISPGQHNLGIFVDIHKRDNERWILTHPAAHLGGFIRGSLSVTVQDICYVTCEKLKIKVILHYLEEPWIGKARNRVEGAIFRYNPSDDNIMKLNQVPEADVLARIEGSWVSQIYVTLPDSKEKKLLVDLDPLFPAQKSCPPEDDMLPNESRKFWADVTEAIHAKDYARATDLKVAAEEQKRRESAERKERNEEWVPRFFDVSTPGTPSLTKEGEEAIEGINNGNFRLVTRADTVKSSKKTTPTAPATAEVESLI